MQKLITLTAVLFLTLIVGSANAQTTQPATDQTAQDKMDKLLARPAGAGQALPAVINGETTIDATSGKGAVAPNAPAVQVVREGTHLINRTGRLNHSADGQTATFTFDTDGKTMSDPPMVIVPNLKLQAMEGAVISKSTDVHFRISGTVTEYKGRNYILLDKAVVMADVEQQF